MKYVLKSVPGLADVGVPHGVEDGPRTLAPGSGSKNPPYHVDQHEKLKGWNMQYPVSSQNWPWGTGDRCAFLSRLKT